MADDEDDIVWIREEEKEPVTPTTPVTVIEDLPKLTDASDRNGSNQQQQQQQTQLSSNSEPTPEAVTVKTNDGASAAAAAAPAILPEVTISEAPDHNDRDETDRLSTKNSASRPPDTPTSCDESMSFDISEYERNFNKTTQEAKELLDKMEKQSKFVEENNKEAAKDLRHLQDEFNRTGIPEVVHKTIDDVSQVPTATELPSGGLPKNVESVLIGEGVLEEITGTLVLPNGLVLVTDERAGILLFNLEGDVVAKINPPEFRRFWSPVYHKEHILILADAQNADSHWVRHVIKFTVDLQYVAKIECPAWLAECTILRERLSIAYTDYLYLCVCGETFSGIYELTPIGQWTELEYKLSEAYIDMSAFATIGPITQLLVVEGRKNYVLLVSVRESQIVDKKRMAICERPGALARDEAGRLFVANRFSASIQLVDTVRWASEKNVAISEAFVRHFTAAWGLLAIPLKNSVRLQRYSFRSLR
ncbi:unnamed protein product [Caenorhabditis bovis]|uniref:Uncharacterized protein n=1 Tax=Caenorhabditis bovis TaxID=2654633 RepID=A0A8S1EJS1_9PELO|nr:unnamed protein product [Caenorhabditis bovis]